MDAFTIAYIGCALWSSTDNDGNPLDANYDRDDIAPQSLADMVEDCNRFQNIYADLLKQAYEAHHELSIQPYTEEAAGHDFWLTRNHHGAGFWDRGLGEVGALLTEAAHTVGSVDLYVAEGRIYCV